MVWTAGALSEMTRPNTPRVDDLVTESCCLTGEDGRFRVVVPASGATLAFGKDGYECVGPVRARGLRVPVVMKPAARVLGHVDGWAEGFRRGAVAVADELGYRTFADVDARGGLQGFAELGEVAAADVELDGWLRVQASKVEQLPEGYRIQFRRDRTASDRVQQVQVNDQSGCAIEGCLVAVVAEPPEDGSMGAGVRAILVR